jgi:hypothetical protein
MLMETLVSDIVPLITSLDDAIDAWDNIGFKHEHHEEGINK